MPASLNQPEIGQGDAEKSLIDATFAGDDERARALLARWPELASTLRAVRLGVGGTGRDRHVVPGHRERGKPGRTLGHRCSIFATRVTATRAPIGKPHAFCCST